MGQATLVDVNVWLALLAAGHPFHARARAWYASLGPNEAGLCRVVQLGVVRLMGNPKIVGPQPIPTLNAWEATEALLNDQRVTFVSEPDGVNQVIKGLLRYRVPTPNLVTDAYLAAFAIAAGRGFVTWDQGFREFRGLRVVLL